MAKSPELPILAKYPELPILAESPELPIWAEYPELPIWAEFPESTFALGISLIVFSSTKSTHALIKPDNPSFTPIFSFREQNFFLSSVFGSSIASTSVNSFGVPSDRIKS